MGSSSETVRMGMNETPAAERLHIVFLGRRNAGKSSVMNAVTGQSLSVVSDVRGTTTDPVTKTMELLPLGPVVMIDTPGIDDEGELGRLRVKKSMQALRRADIAVLVVDGSLGILREDRALIEAVQKRGIPYLVVYNKADLPASPSASDGWAQTDRLCVSARTGEGITKLKEAIANLRPELDRASLLEGLVKAGDTVVLVVPIDKAAPRGRLILPQQMTLRALLDVGALAVVTRESELSDTLEKLRMPPDLVITDSQVFGLVAERLPSDMRLTSFSILMARYKGNLEQNLQGIRALENLADGDRVLISEGCTHHRQCGDIGTVKLPNWIRSYTGREPEFVTTSGTEFPEALRDYQLIIHCGGCMLNEREMKYRLACAEDQGVPMTNYGLVIAQIHGILERSLQPIRETE